MKLYRIIASIFSLPRGELILVLDPTHHPSHHMWIALTSKGIKRLHLYDGEVEEV